MLRAILNRSWRQHPTKQRLYGHLPPITKNIQVTRTRHAGHNRRNRDEHIRDILLWTLSHGRAKVGRPARTYIQQLGADTGCTLEDLPGVIHDRDRWREMVREIHIGGATWWWTGTTTLGQSGTWSHSNKRVTVMNSHNQIPVNYGRKFG